MTLEDLPSLELYGESSSSQASKGLNFGRFRGDDASVWNYATLWANIAMENDQFIDEFCIKTSIYSGFSMARLNKQIVKIVTGYLLNLTDDDSIAMFNSPFGGRSQVAIANTRVILSDR